uniref:Pedal mucus protein 7 n=1 Tax=Patella vulgata TaxID=6465 RepID=A0A7D5HSR7_PATVU|nr:pedal mucus protein 7 [Patella vulgata]
MANILLVSFVALASVISLTLGQTVVVVNQPGPCFGCVLRNGIGYVVPENPECDTYLQCQYNQNGDAVGTLHRCGFGTYWDQDALTCNHIDLVQCIDTRCLGKSDGYRFKVSGKCNEYYECEGETRQKRACNDGFSFNDTTQTCEADQNCIAPQPVGCTLIEDPNNVCVFGQMVDGIQITQNCAQGLGFNVSTCACSILAPSCGPVSVPCEPLVYIDFETAEAGEYDNYGAVIDTAAGTAYFNGSTSIRILRLSNVEFMGNLKIKVSYKVDYSTPIRRTNEEAVITNGDCGELATIEITRTGPTTNLRAATFDSTLTRTTTDLSVNTQDDWRDVEFFYNKAATKLFGTVNDNTVDKPFNQTIVRSQCAFQVGRGPDLDNFRGWIRYIIVTTCD